MIGQKVDKLEVEGPPKRPTEIGAANSAGLKWTRMFTTMKEEPGEWYLMAESQEVDGAYQIRTRIKKYMDRWMPEGVYEMRSHRVYDGGVFQCSKLYGRFIEPAPRPTLVPGIRGPVPADMRE